MGASDPTAQPSLIDVFTPGAPTTERRYFTRTWLVVLGIGVILGAFNLRVVPVLIMAQALNGLVLPIVASFLFWAVNQPQYLGPHINTRRGNVLFGLVLAVSLFIGGNSLVKSPHGPHLTDKSSDYSTTRQIIPTADC